MLGLLVLTMAPVRQGESRGIVNAKPQALVVPPMSTLLMEVRTTLGLLHARQLTLSGGRPDNLQLPGHGIRGSVQVRSLRSWHLVGMPQSWVERQTRLPSSVQAGGPWLPPLVSHRSSILSTPVTGTRDRLACMPVDWGKLWEPALTS